MTSPVRAFWLGCGVLLSLALPPGSTHAQSVLTFEYSPAPRAQTAIWIEDAKGRYVATVALTEAVAYRGIGNRPGASQMNSGYRWPYGRREGTLPIWAHRRAAAPGAKPFPRVVFQKRVEGFASQTVADQSLDSYYCLQFDPAKATRDNLDAVSCATPFHSDKGRYMTDADVAASYFEPWQDLADATLSKRQALPLNSLYPARMDVTRCGETMACFDHEDVKRFAADVRAVMPEIDAVTIATPPGNSNQSVLFSVPKSWAAGDYTAYIEVNVEGDYNERWNDKVYPTPHNPSADWDYYALTYGYAYRGQPSLVWKLQFRLGPNAPSSFSTDLPVGRASWDYWAEAYGQMQDVSLKADDPSFVSSAAANGGVNRLRADSDGHRFSMNTKGMKATTTPPPKSEDAGQVESPPTSLDTGGPDAAAPASDAGDVPSDGSAGQAVPSEEPSATDNASEPIGPVLDLRLARAKNPLRTHSWVRMQLRAARSELPLHAYEVRVSTEPIVDEVSFIRDGRQAKNATDSAEGATLLSLPVDVPAGQPIEVEIGDLVAQTHYYVGVRATDELNRHGPIRVAQITTTARVFATVSPCFIASAAYGSPLATQVSVLRRFRDRYLLSNGVGGELVAGYYALGAPAAAWLEPHPTLRALVRTVLGPVVQFARWLE